MVPLAPVTMTANAQATLCRDVERRGLNPVHMYMHAHAKLEELHLTDT